MTLSASADKPMMQSAAATAPQDTATPATDSTVVAVPSGVATSSANQKSLQPMTSAGPPQIFHYADQQGSQASQSTQSGPGHPQEGWNPHWYGHTPHQGSVLAGHASYAPVTNAPSGMGTDARLKTAFPPTAIPPPAQYPSGFQPQGYVPHSFVGPGSMRQVHFESPMMQAPIHTNGQQPHTAVLPPSQGFAPGQHAPGQHTNNGWYHAQCHQGIAGHSSVQPLPQGTGHALGVHPGGLPAPSPAWGAAMPVQHQWNPLQYNASAMSHQQYPGYHYTSYPGTQDAVAAGQSAHAGDRNMSQAPTAAPVDMFSGMHIRQS